MKLLHWCWNCLYQMIYYTGVGTVYLYEMIYYTGVGTDSIR